MAEEQGYDSGIINENGAHYTFVKLSDEEYILLTSKNAVIFKPSQKSVDFVNRLYYSFSFKNQGSSF